MQKIIITLLAIFEFIFYTFLMVLIDGINITNKILDLIVHFIGLFVVAFIFYLIIHFILNKLKMKAKRYIYYIVIINLILGLIAPVFLIIVIPNEILTTFSFLVLISAVYYGIFINLVLIFLNYFYTNRKKLG